MFRNYLAAALRNLARNRLYAAINVIGLGVGFAAAILIALFVRDEFSYDKWLPGYENIYRVSVVDERPGQEPAELAAIASEFGPLLMLDFPSVQTATRLVGESAGLRHGDVEAIENFGFWWADPNIFDVLQLKAVAGDLKAALERPDGIVLTRSMARKYFGRDMPIGETIEVDRRFTMTVTAVLEDLPSNTHLNIKLIGSARAPISYFSMLQALGNKADLLRVHTYLRLAPGGSAEELQRDLPAFVDRHPIQRSAMQGAGRTSLLLTPIKAIHLRPNVLLSMQQKPAGSLSTIQSVSVVGVLIVLIASINFVNLMAARGARRAVEVGIRKVSGAERRDLVLQFLGESLIYVALSAILGTAFAELLLPSLNAFLDRTILFDWWHDPAFSGGIAGFALLVAILAGLYPAFVLSAFRPAIVLKGGVVQAGGSGFLRQALVTLQFAVLIALILSTALFQRQTDYALKSGMRVDTDQVLQIGTSVGKCDAAFKDQVQALPGVRAAACSLTNLSVGPSTTAQGPNGAETNVSTNPVDFGYFELYGVRPLAGRLFSRDHVADSAPVDGDIAAEPPIVINETSMRKLGFATPQAAIGQIVSWKRVLAPTPSGIAPDLRQAEVIGVVPDIPTGSLRQPIAPVIFWVAPNLFDILSVKLSGQQIPETLRSIDRLWNRLGDPTAIVRIFLDQNVQALYVDITREARMFAAFAGVAVFIACLGLFGLSAFTAERRTKEIGIRKAMGASRWDIVKLLVWQFTKPVLWANLIAWPVGWFLMNRWLHGFAYHVNLEPWVFLASGAAALVIALATVSTHAFLVARAKPVAALRYE